MTDPIVFTTTRYKCPFCHRTYADRRPTIAHIARCWHNPAARGCKTCAHYRPADPGDWSLSGVAESCAEGVSLDEVPPCKRCGGLGQIEGAPGSVSSCPECGGDPNLAPRKAGPRVDCDLWEVTW